MVHNLFGSDQNNLESAKFNMLQSKRGMMIGIVIIDRTQFRPAKSPAYSQQLRTPPGRVLTADGVFDNSPNNRHNPNPGTEVRWGDQSWGRDDGQLLRCGCSHFHRCDPSGEIGKATKDVSIS